MSGGYASEEPAARRKRSELLAAGESTFEILELDAGRAILCLACGAVSHNENDVRERYCGRCHAFHEPAFLP